MVILHGIKSESIAELKPYKIDYIIPKNYKIFYIF